MRRELEAYVHPEELVGQFSDIVIRTNECTLDIDTLVEYVE